MPPHERQRLVAGLIVAVSLSFLATLVVLGLLTNPWPWYIDICLLLAMLLLTVILNKLEGKLRR